YDLELPLTANAYNYFHVDAEVDFYNCLVTFTVTNSVTNAAKTMTTTIPQYSSWNGFIIASNKWDNKLKENDVNGENTEHYAYLDNITATKIALDDSLVTPSSVPAQEPVPVDAVVEDRNLSGAWLFNQTSPNLTPPPGDYYAVGVASDAGEYINYMKEMQPPTPDPNVSPTPTPGPDSINIMPYILDGSTEYKGVTSYTEFDFYLPKKGSYATVYLTGSKSSTETVGNTITISEAGINSWYGNENYQKVCDANLIECGKWYRMQIIFDDLNPTIQINVKESGADSYPTQVIVSSRNLGGTGTTLGGYYRAIKINPPTITTGSSVDKTVTFPVREPSMATTYIANLRVYNRAVLREYYDYGTTADQDTGDALLGGNKVNSSRLGTIREFVMNQVEGEDGTSSVTITSNANSNNAGAINSPSDVAGKTFTGWDLIYSNGTDAVIGENESEGTDATRLKYAATYIDDPTDTEGTRSHVTAENGMYYMLFEATLPIPDTLAPYDSIRWTATQSGENGKTITGIWKINWGETLPTASGDGGIVFGYGIYKIPKEIDSSTISVSAHAGFNLSQDGITYDGGTGAEDDSTYKAASAAASSTVNEDTEGE
ncbi:MAG: hypothetical protein ACI38A_03620, partial [Candidatus Ornithomonoglobus sp.]